MRVSVAGRDIVDVHYPGLVKTVRTSSLRGSASRWKDEARIRVQRPDWAAVISDELPFGDQAAERFTEALAASASYLEYGSGSSTLHAATVVPAVVSVESDPRFLAAVEDRCRLTALSTGTPQRHFIRADIGGTGAWGVPTFRRPTRARLAKWEAYPLAPWLGLGLRFRAETILVDGRFRVACALAVVLRQPDTEWTLFFDDYAERPEYWAFESFADRVAMHGRMAEFRPRRSGSAGEAQLAFDRYLSDWR